MSLQTRHSARLLAPALVVTAALLGGACGGHGSKPAATETAPSARATGVTTTGCKAPCNRKTGIAYPIADGKATFDSGELGYGPKGATAAANRIEWETPRNLSPGSYTYFCRIHPFMRGAFRVVPD
jgi:hypothetical protein